MIGELERVGDDAPLHGQVARTGGLVARNRKCLVETETNRTVIENEIVRGGREDERVFVARARDDAASKAHESHDEVRARDRHLPPAHTDASAGSRLARDRHVLPTDDHSIRERDPAADFEHHRHVRTRHAIAKRSRSRIVEARDVAHAATPAAEREPPEPLRTGKRDDR
jgi:hypothetical protein